MASDVDLVEKYGPPGVTANGFNENLTLFGSGKAAMWIDATVAGGILENPKQSQVVGKVGYAPAPIAVTPNGSHWLWSWAFAIPSKAKNAEGAKKFAAWATSKQYIQFVGWKRLPGRMPCRPSFGNIWWIEIDDPPLINWIAFEIAMVVGSDRSRCT